MSLGMDDLAVNMPDIEPLRLRTASFNDIDYPLSGSGSGHANQLTLNDYYLKKAPVTSIIHRFYP